MENKVLPLVWIGCIVGVVLLAENFNSKSEHFLGIVDNHEQMISFQYPVEVVDTKAVQGEDVKQGELILEVRRQELAANESLLNDEIRKYSLERNQKTNEILSQIEVLKAKKQEVVADFSYQIQVTQTQLELNRQSLKNISGINLDDLPPTPEIATIQALKEKRNFSVRALDAEIMNLQNQLHASSRPVDAQIAYLENQKKELHRLDKSLRVKAQFNGRVGTINYKPGDLVPAFQPVMTIHSVMPRTINGYINENISNDVKIGQTVWVKSTTHNKNAPAVKGVVESLGSRIVEYPERLTKDPSIKAWGREVMIHLVDEHPLILGEKVDVLLTDKQNESLASIILSEAKAKNDPKSNLTSLKATNTDIEVSGIEASAVLWDHEKQNYLLLSDEEYRKKSGIFLMSKFGEITGHLDLSSLGVKVDDLESISTDSDYIYASSSLSYNKHDELKPKRRQLVRFKYNQQKIESAESVDLYTVFENIVLTQGKTELGKFLKQSIDEHSMDIEGMFIKDYALYLGFKSPWLNQKSVILKLGNVDSIFKLHVTTGEIWQSIALIDPETGTNTQLSDIALVDNKLILTSVKEKGAKNSYLWEYDLANQHLKLLEHYENAYAEGVAFTPDSSKLMVVFDEGNNQISKFKQMPFKAVK